MTSTTYAPHRTTLLTVDPYNDFNTGRLKPPHWFMSSIHMLQRVGQLVPPTNRREPAIRFYKYRRWCTLGSLTVHWLNRSSSWLSARVMRSC
jgi:hypothetical protein